MFMNRISKINNISIEDTTDLEVIDTVKKNSLNPVSSNAVAQALSNLFSFDSNTSTLTINVLENTTSE